MRTVYAIVVVLVLVILFVIETKGSPIWRCPEFKLLPCKSIPQTCTSYRMIYIRHVHLECPACLICADPQPWDNVKPWSMFRTKSSQKKPKRKSRRKRGRRERTREEKKMRRLRRLSRKELNHAT